MTELQLPLTHDRLKEAANSRDGTATAVAFGRASVTRGTKDTQSDFNSAAYDDKASAVAGSADRANDGRSAMTTSSDWVSAVELQPPLNQVQLWLDLLT